MIRFLLVIWAGAFSQPLWECDFENPLSSCFERSKSCKIVPCTNVNTISHCLQVRRRSFGGDCFSKDIALPPDVNVSNPDDYLIAEFKFMPVRHPFNEIYSSGCFVGFQQASFDGIVKWVGLSKTPKPLNNSIVTKDAIQFIDTKNKWSTVRLTIRPEKNEPIKFVIEDYTDSLGVAGDFLIDNITIYRKDFICSLQCNVCIGYDQCISCKKPYVLRQGICLEPNCNILLSLLNYSNPVYSYDSVSMQLRNIHQSCVKLDVKMNGKSRNYQYANDLMYIYLPRNDIENICPFTSHEFTGEYKCLFNLSLLSNQNSIVLAQLSWEMNFQVDLKKEIVSSSGLSAESMKFDLGSQIVKISVQGEGKICSDSDCSSYPESPQLTVGQFFYVELWIKEEGFNKNYKLNLTEAYVMGNGTLIKLEIDQKEVQEKEESVVYKLMVPLVVYNGYLVVSARLVNKDNAEFRLLAETDSEYYVASQMKITTKEPEEDIFPMYALYCIIGIVMGFMFFLVIFNLIKKYYFNKVEKSSEMLKLT